MAKRRSSIVGVCAMVGAAALLGLAGCESTGESLTSVQLNPTPELKTTYQNRDERINTVVVTENTNSQVLREDLGKFFLTDRPTRLKEEPRTR